ETFAPPTSPSAAPKPVMLFIIGNHVSNSTTTRLSIPKLPPDAVEIRLPRRGEAEYLGVSLAQEISELPGHDCADDTELEQRRDCAVARYGRHIRGPRGEAHIRAIFVRHRCAQAEIATRNASQKVGRDEQLAPRLIPSAVVARRIGPFDRGQVRAHGPPDASANGGGHPRRRAVGSRD